MTDPTGTAVLRRAFQADGNRRLGRVRSLTHTILVEHDLMHARNDPLAQFLPHPGHRLAAFAEWFARTVDQQLLAGGWWERYLQRAYDSGLVAGGELVGPLPGRQRPLPAVYSELARRELAGIVAALVQQVSRQAATAAVGKRKPLPMYQQVLTVLKKIGMARLKMFADFMVVKLHNAARLEQFRAAGIERVGIIPELLEPSKPSRFLKHDHALHDHSWRDRRKAEVTMVNVLTAGDDRVCDECDGLAAGGPYPVATAENLIPAHPNCRCVFVVTVGEEVPYGLRGVEPGRQVVIKPEYEGKPISGEPPEPPKPSSLTGITRTEEPTVVPRAGAAIPEEIISVGVTPTGIGRLAGMMQELTTATKIARFMRRIDREEDFILAIANVPYAPDPDLLIRELSALARRRGWKYLIPPDWKQ